jgi:proteasome lid subunit RPN8/RPN11
MRWKALPPDVTSRSVEECPDRFSFLELTRSILSKTPRPVVVFPNKVRTKINQHLSSKNTELGGLLLGEAFTAGTKFNDSPILIKISDSVESENYHSTGVSLRMDTEIWDRVKDHVGTAGIVVGWYHSHPNLGAFFSGTDRRNQAAVFYHAYSLGLVIDPIRHEEKWFLGRESLELPTDLVTSEF